MIKRILPAISGGLLLLQIAVAPASAQDHRDIVSTRQYPWSAVGRVGFGHGWCSAVFIGPKLAATAAHCLWNKATQRQMSAGALSVVAGWDRGSFIDGSGVVRVSIAPKWNPEEMDHYGPDQAAKDWALLELDKPLGEEAGWVALSDGIAVNMTVAAVGYGEDRKHVATAHTGCHVTGRLPSGVWTHDCDAVHGDSGGPVFAWDGGPPRLVALHVAHFGFADGGQSGGAVGVPEFLAEARRMGAPAESGRGTLAADQGAAPPR